MEKAPLTFALALNHQDQFEDKHFGDAEKYCIYEYENGNIEFKTELINAYKEFDEGRHGSKAKGKSIIAFLKKHGVDVLVTRQFGKNIKVINTAFIPVIINHRHADAAIKGLRRHSPHFEQERNRNPENYMLFRLNEHGELTT